MRYSLIVKSVLLLAVAAAPFAHATDIEQACRTVPSEMPASLLPHPASGDLERADESAVPELVPPRTPEVQTATFFCYMACYFCFEGYSWNCSTCADCSANSAENLECAGSAVAVADNHSSAGGRR
jgi:hypothetical protein